MFSPNLMEPDQCVTPFVFKCRNWNAKKVWNIGSMLTICCYSSSQSFFYLLCELCSISGTERFCSTEAKTLTVAHVGFFVKLAMERQGCTILLKQCNRWQDTHWYSSSPSVNTASPSVFNMSESHGLKVLLQLTLFSATKTRDIVLYLLQHHLNPKAAPTPSALIIK